MASQTARLSEVPRVLAVAAPNSVREGVLVCGPLTLVYRLGFMASYPVRLYYGFTLIFVGLREVKTVAPEGLTPFPELHGPHVA